MNITTRTATVVAAAAIGTALVAGCSDDSSSSSMEGHSMGSATAMESAQSADPAANFSDADVMFATMMYPHHAQAVEMADMVEGRTTDPDVIALAGEIAAAQKPEMDQFSAWLSQWGQPAPSSDASSMSGMDHGSGSGMMTDRDMESLMAASGSEFDRQWLTMMIEHHRGAVTMAEKEIADGENPDAIALAQTIVETQNEEITRMQQLLG
ncbi:DUF305 domain-containing protein [Rhodococcoides corynebacterioides]|uniref:DUF305 domain-containing protein n=1 Tax=Rhodococcoides corynebacterioides TaxID=53972 RepID=UPI00082F4A76|nr:DUF305 domain-containing protein [Rhodococcus corynebacterioides]MBY6348934.1 DUF305 domain-containing protein [Rhodococcus corynebacterioides]MBY6361675.1 DUF305 domain-containing protein [Rhodococcus corynebacterioides]